MKEKTLYLAWQDKAQSRRWYPIGRLDVLEPSHYQFRYVRGAERAKGERGFAPLYDFPNLYQKYESAELFPLFKNRVMTPGRPDFRDYLQHLDLGAEADPVEILSVDGGYRATDNFEVFPKLEARDDGSFRCRFFLHGWRHLNTHSEQRLSSLLPGEKLGAAIELTNPASEPSVQIQTTDYVMLGWAPRYLRHDLLRAIIQAPGDFSAELIRINPEPAPMKQRFLIEFRGSWPQLGEADPDLEPLAA